MVAYHLPLTSPQNLAGPTITDIKARHSLIWTLDLFYYSVPHCAGGPPLPACRLIIYRLFVLMPSFVFSAVLSLADFGSFLKSWALRR